MHCRASVKQHQEEEAVTVARQVIVEADPSGQA
jgi:hypothetical protein